jgi:hypothetical protein
LVNCVGGLWVGAGDGEGEGEKGREGLRGSGGWKGKK